MLYYKPKHVAELGTVYQIRVMLEGYVFVHYGSHEKHIFLTAQRTETIHRSLRAQNECGCAYDDRTCWVGVRGATGSAFRRKHVRWVSKK